MEFIDSLRKIIASQIRTELTYGVVTAFTNTSGTYYLTITLSGGTTEITKVRYLRSYVPRVGDTVLVQVKQNDIFVLGALASNERTLAPTAERSTSQTITTSTQTKISFDGVLFDSWNCWDLSPNPTRLTAPIDGIYMAVGTVAFAAAASGHRAMNIYFNNTTELCRSDFPTVGNSIDTHSTVTSPSFEMAKNDYIELRVWQNSGSDLDILAAGDHKPTLTLIYLGP